MRPEDAFGAAPEQFKASVASALRRIEEEKPVRRISYRLAACIAAAILLLCGVVYAAANDWKLFDFYKQNFGYEMSEQAQNAIRQNDVTQQFVVGDVVITLQEAVADGKYLYLSAKAAMREPGTAYLMGMMDSPADWMSIGRQYGDEATRRTYRIAAKEDGKRLLSVEIYAKIIDEEDRGGSGDSVMQADGSLQVMQATEAPTDQQSLEIELKAYIREWFAEEEQFGELLMDSIRFTLPVTPPSEQVTLDLNGEPMPGTAARIDQVSLTVTPLSCYFEVQYTVDELEDKLLTAHSRNVLHFEFADETGEPIPVGLTMSGSRYSPDDVHYVQDGSLRLDKLPKALILRPDSGWGGAADDCLTLTIR